MSHSSADSSNPSYIEYAISVEEQSGHDSELSFLFGEGDESSSSSDLPYIKRRRIAPAEVEAGEEVNQPVQQVVQPNFIVISSDDEEEEIIPPVEQVEEIMPDSPILIPVYVIIDDAEPEGYIVLPDQNNLSPLDRNIQSRRVEEIEGIVEMYLEQRQDADMMAPDEVPPPQFPPAVRHRRCFSF